MTPKELEDICVAAAQAGARVLREKLDQPRTIDFKGRIDLVTDADRASEEAVLRVLAERAPGVAVLAEESGAHAGSADLRFIVDPLDGTTNYAHGLPLFACTVGVESNGQPIAGCTIDPVRNEVFRASRGNGAFNGERRLSVSAETDLGRALVCTGFPYRDRDELPAMLAAWGRFVERSQGTRRLGSAALDLAYVAAGRLDGFWEQGLSPWDVAGGIVLVEEAGGIVSRHDGSAHILAGRQILAAPKALHSKMVQVLQGG